MLKCRFGVYWVKSSLRRPGPRRDQAALFRRAGHAKPGLTRNKPSPMMFSDGCSRPLSAAWELLCGGGERGINLRISALNSRAWLMRGNFMLWASISSLKLYLFPDASSSKLDHSQPNIRDLTGPFQHTWLCAQEKITRSKTLHIIPAGFPPRAPSRTSSARH